MNPSVSLGLKCLLGLGAVGAAGGAGAIWWKGGFSGGGKEDQNKETTEVQNEVSDSGKTSQNDLSNKDTVNPQNDNLKNPPAADLQLFEQDDLGLPPYCEDAGDNGCILDKDKIKKVKFQALGDGKDPVEVTGLEKEDTISVTVEGDGDNKRYIFKNDSDELTISKGNLSLKLPRGKTRFIEDNKKLKQLEIGSYGLPKICETEKSCELTSTDLETIKFSDFDDGEESFSLIEVEGLDRKKTISLTIEGNKYIFESPSLVSIKQTVGASGNPTVELKDGETEFKVDSGKLKKLELGEFGLPEECEFQESKNPTTCSLTPRDLKKVKFKVFGNNPTVSVPNNTKNVTLKIQKVEDSSFPDKRKYIFTPSSSITITSSSEPIQSLTLSSGENTFKKERGGDYLVALPKRMDPTSDVKALDTKISGIGLPETCTFKNKAEGTNKSIECELSTDELKKLKFSGGDNSTLSGGQEVGSEHEGDPKVYKLKIEDFNETQFGSKNIRVTFLNKWEDAWSKDLVISFSGGHENEDPLFIANQSNTEFKINDSNKLEKVWGETTLSEQVGLKCPMDASNSQANCTLKDGSESIKVLINGEEKDFKPKNTSDIENNMTYETNKDGLNQGLKFTVKTPISGTNASDSQALELAAVTYQIKRIPDKGWRFTNK